MQIIQIKLYAINANDCQSRWSWQSSTLLTSFASKVKRCWYFYFSACLHFNMYYFVFVFVFPPSSPNDMLCIQSQTLSVFAPILLLWKRRNAWDLKSEIIFFFSNKSTFCCPDPRCLKNSKPENLNPLLTTKTFDSDHCLAFVWILGLVI